jgi:hypothetical protein
MAAGGILEKREQSKASQYHGGSIPANCKRLQKSLYLSFEGCFLARLQMARPPQKASNNQ